jgi:multidrug resistance efflux pump
MLSLCSIFAAGLISLTNSEALGTEIASLFRFQSIILAWITVLVIIAFHEFAHGITCKQYGGKVQEIGFLLIYFQPAFYCNVSDAWLLPKKSERLWITFAGAYFELFLCAISVFVWRITDTHTVVNYCALVVMATSGIKTFFNLNPLIKLDGYYLLSDYLEIPNLRSNSFRYLGNRIRALIGARLNPLGNLSSREKRIYLAYSILSGAYSYWLFALVLTYVAGLLTQKFQGWGFVLFLSLLIAIFRHPLSRLMHVNASAPAANPSRRIPASLKIAGIFIIFVAFSYFFTTNLKIGGEFVILPIHNADVRAEVAGIIENIYQDEGDVVEQGAVIAQLSTREYQADLEKIKAQIDEKSAKLKLLKAGARQEELSLARTQIAKAEERLKYAQKDLEMDRALLKNNVISVRQFDQSEGNVAILEKELEESKSHLDILLAGNRKEEIDATQAEMNSLEAQKKFLEQQLQSLRITSPIAGVISTHKLREKIGQNVNKGDLIAEVHAVNTMEAEIAIPEKEIADVTVDQRVVLKARSYPQEDFEGKVIAIAPTVTKRENTFDERTILVITRLDNASLLLKPDMSGNAKIYCGERRLIEIIARRIVRFVRVEFWSWW